MNNKEKSTNVKYQFNCVQTNELDFVWKCLHKIVFINQIW